MPWYKGLHSKHPAGNGTVTALYTPLKQEFPPALKPMLK